jgi:hypothetical protein
MRVTKAANRAFRYLQGLGVLLFFLKNKLAFSYYFRCGLMRLEIVKLPFSIIASIPVFRILRFCDCVISSSICFLAYKLF